MKGEKQAGKSKGKGKGKGKGSTAGGLGEEEDEVEDEDELEADPLAWSLGLSLSCAAGVRWPVVVETARLHAPDHSQAKEALQVSQSPISCS